jgi:hypothetical protein
MGDFSVFGTAIKFAAGGDKMKWVEDFLGAMDACGNLVGDFWNGTAFSECQNNIDCRAMCATDNRCEFTPALDGKYGKGDCSAHLGTVFKTAIKDQPKCAEQLGTVIHAAIACEANLNRADCESAKHHPKYTCEWHCGMCTPSASYFPNIAPETVVTTAKVVTTAEVETTGNVGKSLTVKIQVLKDISANVTKALSDAIAAVAKDIEAKGAKAVVTKTAAGWTIVVTDTGSGQAAVEELGAVNNVDLKKKVMDKVTDPTLKSEIDASFSASAEETPPGSSAVTSKSTAFTLFAALATALWA